MIDVIIIGAGPAGLSTAIYARRAGFSVLVLDRGAADSQLAKAAEVENYLGFPSVSGAELQETFTSHAISSGIEIVRRAVLSVERYNGGDGESESESEVKGFKVRTRKNEYICRDLVLAMGRSHRTLGAVGEDTFSGRGVSYCATCDGYFYRGGTVCVVGGGDSALSQAIYLSGICSKVILIHRRDTFRAARYLIDRLAEHPNIELRMNSTVSEIFGDDRARGVLLASGNDTARIECDGVFVAVGETPNMPFEIEGLERGESGEIITDGLCRTGIDGLYAVGDLRKKEVCQIITAVADGALAVEGMIRS